MDRITIRSLHQDTAGVLARVQQGETVEITIRGRPIARIVPVSTGVLTPPTVTLPFAVPNGEAMPGQEAGDVERW
jgi:prevent-host-death family protein